MIWNTWLGSVDSSFYRYFLPTLLLSALLLNAPLVSRAIQRNFYIIAINRGMGHPYLSYDARQEVLTRSYRWVSPINGKRGEITDRAAVEQSELMFAHNFLLESPEFSNYSPGRQLITNPDFTFGTNGWIEYRSSWSPIGGIADDDSVLTYMRNGDGHSSLSQVLTLATDKCYLFSTVGSATRKDEIATLWFYWETYDENSRPVGHSVSSSKGDQMWARRFGVFCLPINEQKEQKVAVSPVNMYGDVTVYLGTARLYELLEGK